MNSSYKLSYANWFCRVKIGFSESYCALLVPYKKLLDLLITIPIKVQRYKIGSLSFYLVLLGTGATKKSSPEAGCSGKAKTAAPE